MSTVVGLSESQAAIVTELASQTHPMNYYIRKPGTQDYEGPFTLPEIKQEIMARRSTMDWQAMEATGQTYRQLGEATGWVSLHALIGEVNFRKPPLDSPVQKPGLKAGWLGTGFGCLALVLGCGFTIACGLAYGMGKANDSGQAVFLSALFGAPIIGIVLGIVWIAFRNRTPKPDQLEGAQAKEKEGENE